MNKLSETQKAYAAGIVDGEGNIRIKRVKVIGKYITNYEYHTYVKVSNTHLELLEYLRRITYIGTISVHAEETSKHKKSWIWSIRKYDIKDFLLAILPYLIIKKRQAELMLEFLETCKIKYNGHYNPVPENINIDRELIFEEFEPLNKTGPK